MTVTLTTNEMRIAYEALAQVSNIKLPIRVSFWITRLVAKLKPEYEASEEARKSLVKQYGEEIPGRPEEFSIRADNVEVITAFNKSWEPIGNEKLTIEGAPTINQDAFEGIEIEPRFLHCWLPFITE